VLQDRVDCALDGGVVETRIAAAGRVEPARLSRTFPSRARQGDVEIEHSTQVDQAEEQ
jgi:hypothetical protein